jgi:hypothetical protein
MCRCGRRDRRVAAKFRTGAETHLGRGSCRRGGRHGAPRVAVRTVVIEPVSASVSRRDRAPGLGGS